MAAQLDLAHLQLVKDSFVDESLQEHFSDLLFEVKLRAHGSAYVCILFEHKSYIDTLAALRPYVPEYHYHLSDLSAYSDEELKRTAELGVGLLLLKHIFQLRPRLPEVLALWYTIRHQPYALGYLEAILRYVLTAGQDIGAEEVRQALAQVAPEGDVLMGTIAQELLQQGLQHRLP